MLNRLKRVLVKSFIGAIALGYLFAEAVLYFVNIFTAPISEWITQKCIWGSYRVPLPLPPRASRSKLHFPKWSGSLYSYWFGGVCCAGYTSHHSKKRPSELVPNPLENLAGADGETGN
jgi:hypothetical protein